MINPFKDLKENMYKKLCILGIIVCIVMLQPSASASVFSDIPIGNWQINFDTFVEFEESVPDLSLRSSNNVNEFLGRLNGIGLISSVIDTDTGLNVYSQDDPGKDINFVFGYDVYSFNLPNYSNLNVINLPTLFSMDNGVMDFYENTHNTIRPIASDLDGFNADSAVISTGEYLGSLQQIGLNFGTFHDGQLLFEASMELNNNLDELNGTIINISTIVGVTDGPPLIDPNAYNLDGIGNIDVQTSVVPIPTALWLFMTGIVGFITINRKQQV